MIHIWIKLNPDIYERRAPMPGTIYQTVLDTFRGLCSCGAESTFFDVKDNEKLVCSRLILNG